MAQCRTTNRIWCRANMAKFWWAHCHRWPPLWSIQKVRSAQRINAQLSINAISQSRTSDLIKDSARPSYWVPDSESPDCAMCKLPFGSAEELTAAASPNHRNQPATFCDRLRHHCRACGLAVCDQCAQGRMAVPDRGWSTEVRVCDGCVQKPRGTAGFYWNERWDDETGVLGLGRSCDRLTDRKRRKREEEREGERGEILSPVIEKNLL